MAIATFYEFEKSWDNKEEFWDSQEVKDVFGDLYSNVYEERKNFEFKKSHSSFIKGFIINGKVYQHYSIEEGFELVGQITCHSSISNSAFSPINFIEKGLIKHEQYWKNCTENRKIFSKGVPWAGNAKYCLTNEHSFGKGKEI